MRQTIRSVAWCVGYSASGILVAFVIKRYSPVPISRVEVGIIALVVTSLCVLLLFPRLLKVPFGKVGVGAFLRGAGLAVPKKVHRHILLGMLAAFLTLSGMLVGSILSGKYSPSSATITAGQAVFSLTPGIWEEVLFRGVMMIILLGATRSLKKAALIQIVIFGMAHIKGVDLLAFVGAFSVMILAVAFTGTAYKTRSLIPGIVSITSTTRSSSSPNCPAGSTRAFGTRRSSSEACGSRWP